MLATRAAPDEAGTRVLARSLQARIELVESSYNETSAATNAAARTSRCLSLSLSLSLLSLSLFLSI
jgi:hypothetical protein